MLYSLQGDDTVLEANGPATIFVKSLQAQNYTLWASSVQGPIGRSDEISHSSPARNFIVIDFAQDRFKQIKQVLDTILNHPSYLIYQLKAAVQTNTAKKKNATNQTNNARLIIDLVQELSGSDYTKLYRNLCNQLNLPINKSQSQISRGLLFRAFSNNAILAYNQGAPYEVEFNVAPASIMPNKKKLLKATQEFIDSPAGQKVLSNHMELTNFCDALAARRINGQVDTDYLQKTMQMMSRKTGYDIDQFKQVLQERINLLKANADLLETAPPFGDYVHLYTQATYVQTIGQQLIANLPEGKGPSSDYDLSEASDFIEMAYPPYLLDQHGSDIDNVVIFNPTTGIWTHETDILYSLLTAIRPYSTKQQFETFEMTFAAKARNSNRVIKPYSGSRYILFNNCVLDVATMKPYPITDPMVRDFHFTERCHINLDYVENPPLPVLKHKRQVDNGDWDPKNFLMAYANNDNQTFDYLMFGFGLGLFGGHNSGVHFDIQGGSRWGKTTLSEIFKALYDNRIVMIPFSSLNEQFPFTSYPSDTSIIWINESNEGVEPLDDKYGTIMYDSLADAQVRFQVKNKGDIFLQNPPQVYIEGTQFIKANELYTGPAGRTLAYKLPEMTTALRNQSYSSSIYDCLHNKKVLQWIVYQALMAYKKIIPVSRMDDLRLNLGNQKDLDLFPNVAQDWRKEFVIGGSTIDDWFEEQIEPFISRDAANPTFFHPSIIYALYLNAYKIANPNDHNGIHAKTNQEVMSRLWTIWKSEDKRYVTNSNIGTKEHDRKKPRKKILSPDKMNFDWSGFDKENTRPYNLQNDSYDKIQIFDKKITDWFSIYINQNPTNPTLPPVTPQQTAAVI